jgi:hypothetical protein
MHRGGVLPGFVSARWVAFEQHTVSRIDFIDPLGHQQEIMSNAIPHAE